MHRELSVFEALDLLGSLEGLTRQNLPKPPAAPTKPSLPADTQAPALSFETSKDEYKPALKDRSVIEALLQFQKEIQSPPPVRQAPAPSAPPAAPRFAPAPFSEVPVEPKPPGYFRKSTGPCSSILRTKRAPR